jgi:hypothetical protein
VGTTKYTYDAASQLLTEDGPFGNDTVSSTYVNRLRTALSLQQPSGAWTNGFRYDAGKRLTNVTSQAGSFTYQFATGSPSLLPIKLSLPNTSYITNVYDSVASPAVECDQVASRDCDAACDTCYKRTVKGYGVAQKL